MHVLVVGSEPDPREDEIDDTETEHEGAMDPHKLHAKKTTQSVRKREQRNKIL